MGESRNHIDLVSVAYRCALSLVPHELRSLVEADTADTPKPSRVIGNFIPDVFFWDADRMIIGEAKTLNDFDRPHSLSQYDAYLAECHNFSGSAVFIISVPWQIFFSAKNYFRRKRLAENHNFRIIVINEANERGEV